MAVLPLARTIQDKSFPVFLLLSSRLSLPLSFRRL